MEQQILEKVESLIRYKYNNVSPDRITAQDLYLSFSLACNIQNTIHGINSRTTNYYNINSPIYKFHRVMGTYWLIPQKDDHFVTMVETSHSVAIRNKSTIYCIVPASVETEWWHSYCKNADVTFVRGRVNIYYNENSSPKPCAVVRFSPDILNKKPKISYLEY